MSIILARSPYATLLGQSEQCIDIEIFILARRHA